MELYYCHPEHVGPESILLIGEESKHLVRVMRAKLGDHVAVTDGQDRQFEVEIVAIGKESAECQILSRSIRQHEPEREVTIAVSLLRNPARFEFMVEKAVELGVRRIIPLICERTIAKGEKKERLQKLALAAMKQSGRSWLPPVEGAKTFDAFCAAADPFLIRILPHEKSPTELTIPRVLDAGPRYGGVVLAIGPEGGFSDEEFARATAAGFSPVSLGQRRLRAETAALAALSKILI